MAEDLDVQTFSEGKRHWRISRLLKLSEDLEVMEIPMKHMNIYNLHPAVSNILSFVNHVKRVNECDLECPIILDEEGYVMDGRHRIAKALLLDKESILAVRFPKTPPCCYIEDNS